MAIIPNALGATQPRGVVGTWANMEEDNARTAFAASEFAAGVPLMLGSDEMTVSPLATANRFIGIALRTNDMQGAATSDGEATYTKSSLLGVADMGTVFVLAGESVTEGAVPYYDTTTRKFHGTSDTGRLPLPTCEFDESAADGEPVALRIRVLPGAANVTAVSG